MSAFARQLEKKIIGTIGKVVRGEITAKEAGLNNKIERLKEMDEVAASEMQTKYINAMVNKNRSN